MQFAFRSNKCFGNLAARKYVEILSNDNFDSIITNIIFYFLQVMKNDENINKRLIRALSHFIFLLKDQYYKTNALKKYIYYNCEFVFSIASINDKLFVERASDIWNLFFYFENEMKKKAKIVAPMIDLTIVSDAYARNFNAMRKNPEKIFNILKNDEKFIFNEINNEIFILMNKFQNFLKKL